jgi:RimJ/RimL family protein N-acetyltransferase
VSGCIAGNAASRNLLMKIGFRDTHMRIGPSRPRGRDVTLVRMALPALSAGLRAYSLNAREK